MNSEDKYLGLKGDLKHNIDAYRDTLKKRARAAKLAFPLVTLVLLLLLFVRSSDKVEILLLWVCAMLILSAYLTLLEYFDKTWLDKLDYISDRYDYYDDEEYEDEEEEESPAAAEKVVAER